MGSLAWWTGGPMRPEGFDFSPRDRASDSGARDRLAARLSDIAAKLDEPVKKAEGIDRMKARFLAFIRKRRAER